MQEIQTSILEENKYERLLSAFSWWEKRRLMYNVFVLCGGALGLTLSFYDKSIVDLLGAFIWGLVANVFYCLGFLSEVFIKHYFKKKDDFSLRRKETLFWLGTVFSTLLTLSVPVLYSMMLWAGKIH